MFPKYYQLAPSANGPFRFIFYITDELSNPSQNPYLTFKWKSLDITFLFFSYLIFNDDQFVYLMTFEWFKAECDTVSHEMLNKFDKKSSKWIKKLEFEDKFTDFYGCELVMMIPRQTEFGSSYWGYAEVNYYATDFEVFGLTPEIFEIAAKKYNFTPAFQPVSVDEPYKYELPSQRKEALLKINGTFKIPNFEIAIISTRLMNQEPTRLSQIFVQNKYELYVTPIEDFMPYEKFLMLFDGLTWILLNLAALCLILTLLAAYLLSFFLSSKLSFSWKMFKHFHVTFITFASICAIFGIFFQCKSFSFMSVEPKKSQPKNIQDLIDLNYTIYEFCMPMYEGVIEEELDEW